MEQVKFKKLATGKFSANLSLYSINNKDGQRNFEIP